MKLIYISICINFKVSYIKGKSFIKLVPGNIHKVNCGRYEAYKEIAIVVSKF